MKNSFAIYAEYETYFDKLTADEQAKLLKALFTVFRNSDTAELENGMRPETQMAFAFMKTRLQADTECDKSKCLINKNNGMLGGRPIKNRTVITETERLLQKPNGYCDNKMPVNKPAKAKITLTDEELSKLIKENFKDLDVRNKFVEYVNMRKGIGKNAAISTLGTFNGCVADLRKFANTKEEAMAVLQQSITNSWRGLFALKQQDKKIVEEVPPYAN